MEDKKPWPRILQDLLQSIFPEVEVQVINGAIPYVLLRSTLTVAQPAPITLPTVMTTMYPTLLIFTCSKLPSTIL